MKRPYAYSESPHYSPEIQRMLDLTKICLNCGRRLSRLDHKDKRRNRGYCSIDCFSAKSPSVAYIEKEFGKPIREVVLEILNNNNTTVEAASGRLGIGRCQFYGWLRKLGIKKKVVWG